MELRHLRYFLAVADAGHMTHAAAALGIQQPPLSQQIRALERELRVELFRRHPKGVALTDAGRALQEDARRIVEDVAALRRRMDGIADGSGGTLRVGFTSSAAAHRYTPAALRAARAEYPDIGLELSEDNAAGLIEKLATSRLDCGLLRVPVDRPPSLRFETLLNEGVRVALPVDHPRARASASDGPPLRLAELRDEGWILVRRPGAPGLYANLLALCEVEGFRPRVAAEVDRMMTNLNLVAAGAGISVVPASMAGTHAHAIAYRPLDAGGALDAPLTLVWRRDGETTGALATVLALLRRLAADWHGD